MLTGTRASRPPAYPRDAASMFKDPAVNPGAAREPGFFRAPIRALVLLRSVGYRRARSGPVPTVAHGSQHWQSG